MFSPRKTDNFPGNPGTFGIIVAVLIALTLFTQLFSYGTAPFILAGVLALFGLWWVYDKYVRKTLNHDEMAKYRKALAKQKKKKITPPPQEKGKVVYLKSYKRK